MRILQKLIGRRSVAVINIAFGILFGVGRAHAQNAQAERLFEEGNKLMADGKLVQACAAFEASNRVEPRAGTLIQLGECRERNQQFASAWSAYKDVLNLATDPRKQKFATTQAAALEPRLSYLTVTISDQSRIRGLVLTRNGTSLDPMLWNRALPVDGGDHVITARAPGYETWQKTVHVPVERAKLSVDVPTLAKMSKVTASGGTSPPTSSSPSAASSTASNPPVASPASPTVIVPVTTIVQQAQSLHVELAEPARKTGVALGVGAAPPIRKYLTIGAGATGVAAVGIGLLFGAKARSTYNDAKALCVNLTCDPADYPKGKQLIQDAHSDATVSNVLVAAGGAAIVASAILFLTTPGEREQATARITPIIHDGGTGLAIIGRF
jgi:hypothetical protein